MIGFNEVLQLFSAAFAVCFGWKLAQMIVNTSVFCINVYMANRRERKEQAKLKAAAPSAELSTENRPSAFAGCPPPGGKCECTKPPAPGQYK